MDEIEIGVAQALLEINAVRFTPEDPLILKSGIQSPIYVDNRRLPFWPLQWRIVLNAFQAFITQKEIQFDVIAGIEAAGIPHSSALAYSLHKPSVFVRKTVKEHGTRSQVEGGDVSGTRVLLIEDHVTTGGSSLAGIAALRNQGATVEDCLSITSYELPATRENFSSEGVRLHVLSGFQTVVKEGYRLGQFSATSRDIIEDWIKDPIGWGARQQLSK